MACCGKKRAHPSALVKPSFTVMGNYKYLNNQQIMKRLQIFKNLYCKECEAKELCTYEVYKMCKKATSIEKR